MGDKYKIKKGDLKQLFASAEMFMENRYHELYKKLEWRQGSNKNFFCINEEAHARGTDKHPSMSVDNVTGQWHCFTCDIKGNFQSHWREFVKGGEYGDSYTDFLIDFLGLDKSQYLSFSTKDDQEDLKETSKKIKEFFKLVHSEQFKKKGRPWILSGELSEIAKEMTAIPMKTLDGWVDQLLNNERRMKYLYDTRRITTEIIKKYKIGWFEHVTQTKRGPRRTWKYAFPMINAEGSFINAKAYDPENPNSSFKWMHVYKNADKCPVPINNFTKQKIMFLEGEPDLYCAISMGYEGAVTMGSKAFKDVDKVFGKDHAKLLFSGKEIVICLDSDNASKVPARELAVSLYPYAKQIKIINLDRSEINPHGLDPSETVESDGKQKRTEKDFTDFMKKNGFGEVAVKRFNDLVEKTEVFVHNVDRKRKQVYKVTLQESRTAKYFSSDRDKELELVASVSDMNYDAFMYPKEFIAECHVMGCSEKAKNSCKECSIFLDPESETNKTLTFKIVRERQKEDLNNRRCIEVSDHNILGLIEVSDTQKMMHLKRLAKIHDRCRHVLIMDSVQEKLLHVRLAKDVNEYESEKKREVSTGSADIDIEAYIQGDADIYPNKSYKFNATQTTAWNGQHAVLFIHEAEPVATSIDSFKMDQDIHDLLKIFKPKNGESIKEHLFRRYSIFANDAGVTGRKELFFINDLAYFSPLEINNKMLPQVKRGWVEVLIAGHSRTCKTLISEYLNKHYKVGEKVGGSSAVSRSGLLGGTSFFNKKPQISWGKIPMNDGGIVIIDEMHNISPAHIDTLTNARSSGKAQIEGIISSVANARTRKIMISNPRNENQENIMMTGSGIQFLKDLCLNKGEILARFDVAFVVRDDDVKVQDFESNYAEITTEFNEYQCQHLIMWAYSRKAEDIIFEDGFNEHVNKVSGELDKKFHKSTHLINQERANIVRLSVSLATMLYSTPEDDWDKIFVSKEHLDYVVEFLNGIYCHPNMKLDQYSKRMICQESLGNMDFLKNIDKYVDLSQLSREQEFTERSLQQIFYDFLQRVANKFNYLPNAKTDSMQTHGYYVSEGNQKLIGILTARNCLSRTKKGMYRKTEKFTEWLQRRSDIEDAGGTPETSDILELESGKSNITVIKKAEEGDNTNGSAPKRGKDKLGQRTEFRSI